MIRFKNRASYLSSSPLFTTLLLTTVLAYFTLSVPLTILADDSTIDQQIYTQFVTQGYCVRLSHQLDVIGCNTPLGGLSGQIRLAQDQASLTALLADPPSSTVALLLDHSLFTRTNLRAIASTLDVAGIMLLPTDSSASSGPIPPAGGFSPSTKMPQFLPYIPSTPAIPNRPTGTIIFNNTYEWNPTGEDMLLDDYEFAIVTVTFLERDYLLGLAQTNEAKAASGSFVYNMAQFNFHMYAQTSTSQCLSDATCIPVGGYSIWGSLGNITLNSTTNPLPPSATPKPYILMQTKLDAAAFFHQLSPGGDESQASVAVLTAAVRVLANTTGVGNLPTQILFALFQGESWSHVGSRKFVDDLQNFQCQDLNTDGSGPDCNTPWKNDLTFQSIQLSQITKIVEVGQIGLNTSVFVHRQRDGNAVTTQMINTVYAVAANLTTPLTVAPALTETPGIPPACAEAFLEARPSIATVMLTDHAGPFTNQYYQSEFDNSLNLILQHTGNPLLTHPNLCAKATLLARMVWIEAGGDIATSLTINADCIFLDQLIHCLLEDPNCDLANTYNSGSYSSNAPGYNAPSHYSSVYNLMPENYIGDSTRFLAQIINSWILNATSYQSAPADVDPSDWPAPPNNLHYHDAVDPNLVFNTDLNRWTIKPTANDRYLFTESNWDSGIGWQTFRQEDPKNEVMTLVVGLIVAAVTVITVGLLQRYCQKRFKRLQH